MNVPPATTPAAAVIPGCSLIQFPKPVPSLSSGFGLSVSMGVTVGEGNGVADGSGDAVGVTEGSDEPSGAGVGLGSMDAEGSGVDEGLPEGEGVGAGVVLPVGVGAGVGEGDAVGLAEGLGDGLAEGLAEAGASSLWTATRYCCAVTPSCAVTLMINRLLPTSSGIVPVPDTDAFISCGVAVSSMLSFSNGNSIPA